MDNPPIPLAAEMDERRVDDSALENPTKPTSQGDEF